MNIWIDKQGGMHYHKGTCKLVKDARFPYEQIEHKVRRLGMPYHKQYTVITIDKRRYNPCPFCFGYGARK